MRETEPYQQAPPRSVRDLHSDLTQGLNELQAKLNQQLALKGAEPESLTGEPTREQSQYTQDESVKPQGVGLIYNRLTPLDTKDVGKSNTIEETKNQQVVGEEDIDEESFAS